MKKLLLLGGLRYLIPVIKSAQKMGFYVITCDYLPDNPAHKYSNEYHNISILDKEAVLELAQRLKIDGVMSFAVDPGVATATYVSGKLNLPSPGPYESILILQNKGLFREFLEQHNFNVPKSKTYTNSDQAIQELSYFELPVIVKPVDSAGSKGVMKVTHKNELSNVIQKALSFSPSKTIIIEEFLEAKNFSSDTDCFSVNGELKFISFSNQRFDSESPNPFTPSAYSWPSTISEENQTLLKSELQRLIHLLKMKSSVYNIEVREATNGKAYIMEVSPRGGGNRLSEMLNSERHRCFGQRKKNLPDECSDCRWLNLCRGGCPKDRLQGQGAEALNHLCSAYQMFFEYSDERFRALADRWKRQFQHSNERGEDRTGEQPADGKVGRNHPCPCGSGKKYKKCCGL